MNGAAKISILFILILMMIVLPLALSRMPGKADAPTAVLSEPVRTIHDYQDRAALALRATSDTMTPAMARRLEMSARGAGQPRSS